jgi:hypothetical protein
MPAPVLTPSTFSLPSIRSGSRAAPQGNGVTVSHISSIIGLAKLIFARLALDLRCRVKLFCGNQALFQPVSNIECGDVSPNFEKLKWKYRLKDKPGDGTPFVDVLQWFELTPCEGVNEFTAKGGKGNVTVP